MTNRKKIALITGGNSGIGLGVAAALLKEGYNVAITSRSQARADEAVKKLSEENFGNEIMGVEADVRDFEAQQKVVDKIIKKWGGLDVCIANAGLGHFSSIEDLSIEKWHEMIDTNLTGAFYSIKACVSALKKSKGYYITISSLAGTNFFAGGSGYNASKFGVTGFTQAVMLDLRQSGVKVTTIMPGSVATAFNNDGVENTDAWKLQKEDMGELVVDLLAMNPRALPSKVEIRPTQPPLK